MYLRPFFACCLLSAALLAQGQASNLVAQHRDGQTFLTWTEATAPTVPDDYNVYVKATPIQAAADLAGATLLATVVKGSYWNARAGQAFVLKDQAPPLVAGTGFLVTTPAVSGSRYFAVCARSNSVENTVISSGAGGNAVGPVNETVALPKPVLQLVADAGQELNYVHFLPAVTNPAVRAQTNRENRALNYRIWHDPQSTGPRPVLLVLHSRGSSYKATKSIAWMPANGLQVFLDDDNDPFLHSIWFGYHEKYPQGPAAGMIHDYTERRILWTLDQVLKSPLLADANRVYCVGGSYGAMGALAMGLRYPDVFAAVAGIVPAFGVTHQDFALTQDTDTLFGTVAQNLLTNLGPRVYDLFDYQRQVAALDVTGMAPMAFTCGRADAVTGWTDKPGFFRTALTARQPVSFYWDYRSHTTPGPWSNLEPALFAELFQVRLDRPLPAFANLSLDDNPGNGNPFNGDLTGCMSGYATFDPATASETAAKVTLDLSLKSDLTRLDYAKQPIAYASVVVRRLRQFAVKAGSYYKLTARQRGQTPIEEERILVADAQGRLAVSKLQLERGFRTVEIVPYVPADLPEVHFGGTTAIGGTLALAHLAPGNQYFMWCWGGIEGALPTPFGVWRILDPIFLAGGVTPANGLLEAVINLPNDPRFRGIRLLGQSMVGLKIGPLARVTLR